MRLLRCILFPIFVIFVHGAVVIKYPSGFLTNQISYAITDQVEKSPEVKWCVLKAMEYVTNNSCVRFVQLSRHITSSSSGYLLIDGHKVDWTCTSSLGLQNGNPTLLQFGASCGTKIKECVRTVLRALGFEREHLRADRGHYVTVSEDDGSETTRRGWRRGVGDNSIRFGATLNPDMVQYVTPYDLSSITHFDTQDILNYGNRYTIRPRLPIVDHSLGNTLRGDRDPLSHRDKAALNSVFKCSAGCPKTSCKFDGYLAHSCRCVCAHGFSGKYCEHLKNIRYFKAPICGFVTALPEGSISSPNFPKQYPRGIFCQWLLQAPHSWQKIEFRLDEFDLEFEELVTSERCHDTLKIWPHGTAVATNKLSCLPEDESMYKRVTYRTQSNWLLVEFRSYNWGQFNHTGFKISYKLIDERRFEKPEAQSDSVSSGAKGTTVTAVLTGAIGEVTTLLSNTTRLHCYSCTDRLRCNVSTSLLPVIHCKSVHACSTTIDTASQSVVWRGCTHANTCIAHIQKGCHTTARRCTTCCARDVCNAVASLAVTVRVSSRFVLALVAVLLRWS